MHEDAARQLERQARVRLHGDLRLVGHLLLEQGDGLLGALESRDKRVDGGWRRLL